MKRHFTLIAIKIVLTLPVTYALAYPFLNTGVSGGVFNEIESVGPLGSLLVGAGFLALVFLYCRDLYQSLSLVRSSARKASPRSVWLMFLIPYNFVEDFFIIANVAKSLEQEAQHNTALHAFNRFGRLSGMGWCTAQIVSLLPNEVGTLAGFLALPLWITHWRFIRRVNAVMIEAARTHPQANPMRE